MKKAAMFALITSVLVGCASTGHVVQMSDVKATGPKVIALNAPSAPWVGEIQNRLKQEGFKVLRWSSRTRVTQQAGNNRLEQFS
jgi:hypothetical protein